MELLSVPLEKTCLVRTDKLPMLNGRFLKSTRFYNSEESLIVCSSAGIVCFAVEPKTNNIFILLGKESHMGGVWCSFSGKPNLGETIEKAAAREFSEESMGCIQISTNKKKNYQQTKNNDQTNKATETDKRKEKAAKTNAVSESAF